MATLAFLAMFIGGALLALAVAAAQSPNAFTASFDSYFVKIAGFTLWQAGLSTLLSLFPAVWIARALHRHPVFYGRDFVLRLFALPLALPALIAALGLLALFGRAGILAPLLSSTFDARWPGIYGLGGILLAHVFFNLPLAVRMFLTALEAIPGDQLRLAAQLGFSPFAQFRLLEWPALKAAAPGIATLVFLLCATSFTLVLVLGGGPQATTMEVAIYQALRFDYAPERAVAFALVQLAFAFILAWLASRFWAVDPAAGLEIRAVKLIVPTLFEKLLNGVLIGATIMFVLAPILAIVARGVKANLAALVVQYSVLSALATSVILAAFASFLALLFAIVLLSARSKPIIGFASSGGGILLSLSPVVIGAGWFIALQGFINPLQVAPVLIVAVNAAMAVPFVLRALSPAWSASRARHDLLADSLSLNGLTRFRLIEGLALRRPLIAALAFAAALSLGDLGVVALFGSDQLQTLPSLLFARLGSYRTNDAAGLALILMAICLGLLWLADVFAHKESR